MTFGNLPNKYKWRGGVLAGDGGIYCIPLNSPTVLKIDTRGTNALSEFGDLQGFYKWREGVLGADGNVYGIPLADTSVLRINPQGKRGLPMAERFGNLPGSGFKWCGGVLAHDGCIYGIPFDAAGTPRKA